MHERKAKMTELCDGFVCLPGGIGTLDEMFEAWTWNALGYHAKPFCLLNVHGFWNDLADFMDHVRDSGFLSQARRLQMLKAESPAEALDLGRVRAAEHDQVRVGPQEPHRHGVRAGVRADRGQPQDRGGRQPARGVGVPGCGGVEQRSRRPCIDGLVCGVRAPQVWRC